MNEKSSIKGIVIMIIASLFTSIGQLSWKIFQNERIISFLLLGFILYGIGAILMIMAFKYGKYSAVHPMLCTSYVFAIIFGHIFLKENINRLQIIGILIIVIGVILIGRSDE